MTDYCIRTLNAADLPGLKDFAPAEWNTDLSITFSFHFGQPYFYPIGCEIDGKIVGCANGLQHGKTGWFGNIIVLPEYRGRGIGRMLTHHLANYFDERGVIHQLLIATKMGEPLYRMAGFALVSQYVFLKPSDAVLPDPAKRCRTIQVEDAGAILELDQAVTGEQRSPFISRYWQDGWVHTTPAGTLDGYYLPRLAHGLVIAANDEAGLDLLRIKIGLGIGAMGVPEQNYAALEFLQANGYVETARAPRMCRGQEVAWQPERIYARGSGFCG